MTFRKCNDEITQERLKQVLHYDPDTGVFTHILARPSVTVGKVAGRKCFGYTRISVDYKQYMAHRLAWLYVYGKWPEGCIDHINMNRSDNRICNLRDATPAQNKHNMGKLKNNKSGYKGVMLCKRTLKYKAAITANGKQIHLGYFDTAEAAHKAFCDAAVDVHGEFARVA